MTTHQDTSTERERFEKWYVDHCPDIVIEPIGCRTFVLQWKAWQAALASRDEAAQQPQVQSLQEMEARKDAAYLERNQVVAALAKCFPSGIARTAIDGWSEDWHGCVYIDLPTGQASWHFHDSHADLFADLPPYQGKWDGHTTEEKYARLAALKSQGQAVSDADVLTRAIQRLNVNPYSMTKQECITLLQELRDDILALRDKPEQRVPLSEKQIVDCIVKAECLGTVRMSFESGSYSITRPSLNASKLVRAIEAAHGITAMEQGE